MERFVIIVNGLAATSKMERFVIIVNGLAVNYYDKALHLGCCSRPRSASDIEFNFSLDQVSSYHLLSYLKRLFLFN